MRNLKNAYFTWLYETVVDRRGPGNCYSKLCRVLYEREFTWFIPNDDNRCQDGKDLREHFLHDRRGAEPPSIIDRFLEENCSVLEVLVAVAFRMDFILYDLNREEKVRKWFALLLDNLKLNHLSDDCTDQPEFLPGSREMREIDKVLDIFLNRKYDKYGNGSLFPVRGNTPRDMTRTEIWYQMQAYIQENFDI